MKYYVKTQDGTRIFVEDINNKGKNTILFVHGWPLEHNMWEYQVERLIRRGHRCIAIDLRGYGKSDRPESGYYYDIMARDIMDVLNVLNLRDITLVGHSMGGAICIRYASKYKSERLSNLVLLGAAAPAWTKQGDWEYGYTKRQVDDLIKQANSERPKMIENIRDQFFYKYVPPIVGQWFYDLCISAAGWATVNSLMALRDETLFDDLRNISVPTLILHGTHDLVCPFEFAEYMNTMIPNSKLVPLTESGHAPFYDQKDEVSDELNKFTKKI